ncbi:MAG: RDD family protein [Novosphingobium sp.]|nr:RDD family protein [Novosphingobium sp.]
MNQAVTARLRHDRRERLMLTPEGIALPVTIASRGTRAGALILDLTIIVILMIATTITLVGIAGGTAGRFAQIEEPGAIGQAIEFLAVIWIVAMFLFRNAYFMYFELGPRGATPGKRMTGIRIAARDGGRLSVEMVIARNLLRDIELFLPLVFLASAGDDGGAAGLAATAWFLIFALFPFFNKDCLRAGDVIAGSWVLETPRRKLETAMSVEKPSSDSGGPAVDYSFDEAELMVYGEYEVQTLERVLRENRKEALSAVRDAICLKIGREPNETDPRAFLEAYYNQLRALLEANMRMGQRKADKHS